MKADGTKQLIPGNIEARPRVYGAIILNKEKFIQVFSDLGNMRFRKVYSTKRVDTPSMYICISDATSAFSLR